jgi:hypothetical protein
MENIVVIPQKIKNSITVWSRNSISGYILKMIVSRVSKRYLYTHVHSSMIHNNQKVEVTQVSIDGSMDKQNMAR